MDGWMDGWMDAGMDWFEGDWMDGGMGWIDAFDASMHRCIDGWIDSLIDFNLTWLIRLPVLVGPGHRAIVYDHYFGIRHKVYGEGAHFLVPFLQYPIFMDVRTRPRILSTQTGTKDMQHVQLQLRILSRPLDTHIREMYQKIGPDFDERILPSIGNEVLKAVVAQYNADQLLTLRHQVSTEIQESLRERARQFNLVLEDVAITHLTFSKDFTSAIEHKQVAQQMAERAKFVVQKAEHEKRASVVKAEGDAEAARLVSDAIEQHGPGLVEVRRIETAVDVAKMMSRSQNVHYLPSGNNMLLNLKPN
eukprot:TRINITY_DN65744_c7_g1_i1.p1 TRINITY_DN65744_c7_g1~~TRINITY_DN65744_c7_g1_i1.p1  ORF type:complete len:305 (+),score=138.30 TRINITY_DN65744_c7_g1_i1:202-1116(+)